MRSTIYYKQHAKNILCDYTISQLKHIGNMLYEFQDKFGAFPVRYSIDENGNRLHSWRTILLANCEETKIDFEFIDLNSPWEQEANKEVFRYLGARYFESGTNRDISERESCCFDVVDDILRPATNPGQIHNTSSKEIVERNGPQTIIIAESFYTCHWMNPYSNLGLHNMSQSKEAYGLCVDGSVCPLRRQ